MRAREKMRQVVYDVPFDELHVVGARVHRQSGAFHVAVGQLHRELAAFRICFALRQPLIQKQKGRDGSFVPSMALQPSTRFSTARFQHRLCTDWLTSTSL